MSERPPNPRPNGPVRTRRDVRNRASLQVAAGTVLSRLTGLLRLVMVAYALGGGSVGDAFNLANSTPNIIHDLVLGGVLGATFVPVFVERLARSSRARAIESISAVITLSAVMLVVTTVLFELAAPSIISLYTFGSADPAEHQLAVTLLRYFAPQLLFYGAISLIAAVLAVEDRFTSVGLVPILNNVVGIVTLGVFASLDHAATVGSLNHRGSLVAFLALGTTAGVALQAVALLPSLRRASIRIRFIWRPRDPAIRTIISLSSWTFGFVAANQLAVFVILALEYHLGTGKVSAYTYAYTFFQFPFGVAAASIVNVATPDLARAWAADDPGLVGRRFGVAIRQLFAVILPSMVTYLVLAGPAVALLLQHGRETAGDARLTASVLVLFALGLPGYCVYFLAIRTFQAMQDTRTAFGCYALENGLNIVLAAALYHPLGIQGLALAYSIAYGVAAVVALAVIRQRLGTIGGSALVTSSLRSLGLAIVMAVAIAFVATLIGTGSGISGWIHLLVAVGVGAAIYLGGAGVAGTLSANRSTRRQVTSGAHYGGNQARVSRRRH